MVLISVVANGKQHLPISIVQNNIKFERCDEFTFRYGLMIKVADVGWYSPHCDAASLLESSTKILRFYYHKDIKANFFKSSAEKYFILNLETDSQKDTLIEPLLKFNQAYTNVLSGEYYHLLLKDDLQLSLFKNDSLLTTIENKEFAVKYFNIWFGKNPVIKKLKTAFL